ncbi:MAG: D-3-phosphoglycerate dehydrogenase [Candidatus Heimdallarchaeota archaeon LC_3]|nr:MAG: D-3-phosphoglycerate dehydrogenase [Candidatus Heimdallarchaeota archaeon LC_3]
MKILIPDIIDKEAVELLKNQHEVTENELTPVELLEQISEFDAVLVRSRTKITSEVISSGKYLKVIGRAGIGVDNIDVKTATSKKIPVVFAPQGSTISVAEATVAQILSLSRNLVKADITMKEGLWNKKKLMGTEIFGKTLGLIGLGRIGIEVAKRCQAFGMNVQAYDPYISAENVKKFNINLLNSKDELLSSSDVVSIHAILTEETRNMIQYDDFKNMKSSALIVNFGRGGIINENDLVKALLEKLIRGAALDVYSEEPLPKNSFLRNNEILLHLSPHIGASTKEAQKRAGTIVVEEMLKVLSDKKPEFCVNKEIFDNS